MRLQLCCGRRLAGISRDRGEMAVEWPCPWTDPQGHCMVSGSELPASGVGLKNTVKAFEYQRIDYQTWGCQSQGYSCMTAYRQYVDVINWRPSPMAGWGSTKHEHASCIQGEIPADHSSICACNMFTLCVLVSNIKSLRRHAIADCHVSTLRHHIGSMVAGEDATKFQPFPVTKRPDVLQCLGPSMCCVAARVAQAAQRSEGRVRTRRVQGLQ